MSGLLSEHRIPEEGMSQFWPCCQDCRYRKKCPYVFDELVCQAAGEGHTAAARMTEEASRLQERISCAECTGCLLNIDRDLEDALSQALCTEMDLIGRLSSQTVKYK